MSQPLQIWLQVLVKRASPQIRYLAFSALSIVKGRFQKEQNLCWIFKYIFGKFCKAILNCFSLSSNCIAVQRLANEPAASGQVDRVIPPRTIQMCIYLPTIWRIMFIIAFAIPRGISWGNDFTTAVMSDGILFSFYYYSSSFFSFSSFILSFSYSIRFSSYYF